MSADTPAGDTPSSPSGARLGWVIVYVQDVERALAFYERAFGLKRHFIAPDASFGELETGATTLAFASEELADSNFAGGFQRGAPDAPPFNIEICLVFHDVTGAFEHAVASGATPLKAPALKPWGQTVGYLRDPFGTLVELASPLG
jgi:uncharacterized glyoxalase superfamily protein PhnB